MDVALHLTLYIKLQDKIRVLLQQIDEVIVQDKAAEAERVEFTTDTLNTFIGELKDALASKPEPADKEQKKQHREKKKQRPEGCIRVWSDRCSSRLLSCA